MYCSMIHPSRDARMVGFTLSKDCECQTVAIEGQFRFVVTASDRDSARALLELPQEFFYRDVFRWPLRNITLNN